MIKNITLRKVRNRGHEPVKYRMHDGVAYGYIAKRGRKWMYFYSASTGRKKVLLEEEQYMTPITK